MPKGFPNKKIEGIVYAARQAFTTLLDGVPVTVPKGATARAGHKILQGREELFEKLRIDFEVADDDGADDPAPAPVVTLNPPNAPPAPHKPAA